MAAMAQKRRLSKAVRDALKALGREGGLTRAKQLSADQRKAIAKKAARARWGPRRTRKRQEG